MKELYSWRVRTILGEIAGEYVSTLFDIIRNRYESESIFTSREIRSICNYLDISVNDRKRLSETLASLNLYIG